MAEIEEGAHEKKPWSNRYLVDPKRTYSGRVVYDTPRHYFRPRDAERIIRAVVDETPFREDQGGWLQALMESIQNVTIYLLEKVLGVLPFLDQIDARDLYNAIHRTMSDFIDRTLGISQSVGDDPREVAKNLMAMIAARAGIEYEIKE